ncbi:hypothetical protein DSM106972_093530 [Dulcicalothrix desertica PCC 7102]|uniref:Uncharacterized protein n=1 Tax=Dulcicalothrix desertica PCC 7102 TaxID=232991 RepID=A0A3S1A689_9CYAN|nr:hypothetical protein DSM106972_093530 [Dulcicalothrix desertica PCC 7102]
MKTKFPEDLILMGELKDSETADAPLKSTEIICVRANNSDVIKSNVLGSEETSNNVIGKCALPLPITL